MKKEHTYEILVYMKYIKILFVVSLAVIILITMYFVVSPTPSDSERTPATAPSHESAEIVGYGFIQRVVELAPPHIPTSREKEDVANMLSVSAKKQVADDTFSRDIAEFIGIQDVPDQGVSVEDLQIISDREAVLVVGLNYSGGRTLRNVHLVAENGVWKVDRITQSEEQVQGTNIEVTGNIVQNNPGMEKDVWHIVYEERGKPALTKALQFSPQSICAVGVENSTCVPASFTQGTRVRIFGTEIDTDTLRVMRLEIE